MEQNVPAFVCASRGERTYEGTDSNGESLSVFGGDYASVTAPSSGAAGSAGTPMDILPGLLGNRSTDVDNLVTPLIEGNDLQFGENAENNFWTGIVTKAFISNYNAGSLQLRKLPKVTGSAVSDGLSNTVLYAEKAVAMDNYSVSGIGEGVAWRQGAVRGDSYGQLGVGAFNTFRIAALPVGDRDIDPANTRGHGALGFQRLGSAHPGDFNAVLGDGSTHTFETKLDINALWDLVQIDDGNVTDLESL